MNGTQKQITQDGYDAYMDGLSENDNPFKIGTMCFYYWREGFEQAEEGRIRP